MMNERIIPVGMVGVERLFQRFQHEARVHRAAYPPADNAYCEDVDDEGHVHPALPGRDVGEVRDPEPLGAIRLELSADRVERTRCRSVGRRGTRHLALSDTPPAYGAHEPLTGQRATAMPSRFIWRQTLSAPRIAHRGGMFPVGGRSDPQDLTGRLDPVSSAVLIDLGVYDFRLRSNPACAKKRPRVGGGKADTVAT